MLVSSANPSAWKYRADYGSGARSMLRARKYRSKCERLNPAQQELATRFLPLARTIARPLKLMYPYWRDEFESAACLALVEAARSYDPRKNIRFATFARFRIRGAMMDVGRAMVLLGLKDQEVRPGLVALTPFNEEHGKVLVANEPPAVGWDVDAIDAIEHWLRKLPERHANVCRMYYLHGKSQAEIAEACGCSQSEITRLHKRAIDMLSDPYAAKPADRAAWKAERAESTREFT